MWHRPRPMVLLCLELAVKARSKGCCSEQLMISQFPVKLLFARGRIPSAPLVVTMGLSTPLHGWEVQPGHWLSLCSHAKVFSLIKC